MSRTRVLKSLLCCGVILAAAGCGRLIPDAPRVGPYGPPSSAPSPWSGAGVGTGAAFSIDAPIDGGTRGAVARAAMRPEDCASVLGAARVTFTPVPDRANTEVCRIERAGTLGADYGVRSRMAPAQPVMTCRLAVALSVWRRQSVEPAAMEILGARVDQIDHMGVYACRNVNSAATGRPSAHARAAAIDIAGVRLSDGRRITITNDWHGNTPEARFLLRIRDDACAIFGTTLSPDYNRLHDDHLHLEAEDGRLCS
ncbi:extensin family protein [Brevundimonas sp. S30B]|uniref:extensin-like domain-containing protein n=1 Tax=unclassified Brevundimonas TaxID=2622653 RepID=UPI001072D5E0|nr:MULTISPECIES: extensin family protein [unclassified Brevundimonas]QBX37082.1 extensin family protein [Brevundimonas sp. MF30-B]TFW04122.1 extensin family protein [Brevundimonas sp. S30B]